MVLLLELRDPSRTRMILNRPLHKCSNLAESRELRSMAFDLDVIPWLPRGELMELSALDMDRPFTDLSRGAHALLVRPMGALKYAL